MATILTVVGYNPYRKFRARRGDYAMVVAVALIAAALIAWAVVG